MTEAPLDEAGLDDLGVVRGQAARFRRHQDEHWHQAVVVRRERDGSVGLRDENGAARAIPVELVEVPAVGRRGGAGWEPLSKRAGRGQLRLDFGESKGDGRRTRRAGR